VLRVTTFVGLGTLLFLTAGCGSSLEEGRALYESAGCGSCHGPNGHGDGPVAASLQVRPTDFRYPSRFRNGSDETAIAGTLLNGVAIHRAATATSDADHDRVMPAFDHLTERQRRSIALYVISLQTGDRP